MLFLKGGYAIEKNWTTIEGDASAASHEIGARNAIEFFSSRPSFGDVASAAGHDIGARNEIEIFWTRPTFGDVASGAGHDIGARNAIEIFEVDQRLEMLRVPLVTIVAREMRFKTFWSRPSFGDVGSAASHDIGARNAIEIFSSRPSFGDVASAASHDIGAGNANEIFLKSTELSRCSECR